MNILYVYAHPQAASFNAALQKQACKQLLSAGHVVEVSDLYAMHFNPLASWDDFTETSEHTQYFLAQQKAYEHHTLTKDIHDEITKLQWADHIIFQFPLWWFSMPAVMKGWFDRIFIKGFAYDADKRFDTGPLKGKTASLVISTQSPESTFQHAGLHGAGIEDFLLPIHHTLRFTGIQPLKPFVIYGAFQLSEERKKQIFDLFQQYLMALLHK